jgi:hypothetical protein
MSNPTGRILAAAALFFLSPGTPAGDAGGKVEPKGAPLQAVLKANKTAYKLDLGGQTADELRKQLKNAADPKQYPPAPEVDLVLELTNTGDQEVQIWVGGDATRLMLELKGKGAVNTEVKGQAFTREFRAPKALKLAPGKSHRIEIKKLEYGMRDRSHRSYWLEPSEHEVTASYQTAVSPAPKGADDAGEGFGRVRVTSAPVKLKVVDPPKGKAQGQSEPAAARPYLLDLLPLVEAKDKSKLNEREREILPEVLKKLEKGKVRTVDKAKDAAQKYKFKVSGILAEEAPHVVSLLPLGTDVPDFGKQGDLVWVVQFRIFQGAITQEVWVNANTGGLRAILPLKR